MDELTLTTKMRSSGLSIKEGSRTSRLEATRKAIEWCIRPRTQSDRTCISNIISWISGLDVNDSAIYVVLRRVIDAAIEASGPMVRNPNAVFMTIMKKELGYSTTGDSNTNSKGA